MKNKVFPQWFIDSVVDGNIRDSLLKGEVSSRETIQFRCQYGHIFSRRIDNYIGCTTMEKKTECPECKKNNRRKYPKELLELLIQEDKEKAIKGSLKSSDMVTIICPKGHKSTFFLGTKVDLSDGILKIPLCHVCSKEKQKENYINNHKKEFPQWFIDSLLYEEDKEKARKGILCSEDPLYFKCPKGHITKGVLYNKIRVSDMTPKNTLCSICGMEEAQAKRKQTVNSKWVFPEWFIDELVNEEDKEKARSHTLSGAEEVELCCPRGHHYKKKVSQRLNLDGSSNYGCEQCFREDQSIKATPYFEYPQWFIDELVDEKDIELAKIGKLPVGKKVKIKCPNCGSTYIRHVRLEMDVVTKERRKICNKCRLEAKKINPLLNRPDYPEWFIDMLVNEEDKEKARTKMLRVDERVQFRCPKGHIYTASVFKRLKLSTSEKRISGCRECAKEIIPIKREAAFAKKRIFPQWFMDDLANEEDKQKALRKELKCTDIVQFKCPVGHIYTQRVGGHIHVRTGERKKGCNICFYQDLRSQPELEIESYIQYLGFNTEHRRFQNPKNPYSYFEVDIYIPEKNIGIEYNGSYFHKTLPKDKYSRERMYHQNKYLTCQQLGIRLISIFEPDWRDRKEKIKQYLKDLLLPVQTKIYARKTEIRKIDYHTANSLYDKYHLLGKTTIQAVSYGLYYNNELLACMSFQKGRYKENKEPVWCLTRFVTVSGYSIVGGASKLLTQFEKEYTPNKLVSYSDNDYFNGGVYSKLGFSYIGPTHSPRYYWWLEDREIKREKAQLHKLEKKFPELYQESLSVEGNREDYIMLHAGAWKVYRAGHIKWEKKYSGNKD